MKSYSLLADKLNPPFGGLALTKASSERDPLLSCYITKLRKHAWI